MDICATLKTASLEGLPSDLLPRRCAACHGGARAPFCARRLRRSSDLVDELASEVAKLRKRGIEKGFVNVKLARWLPQHLAGALRDADEDEAKLSEDLKNLAQARCLTVACARAAPTLSREAMGAKTTPKRVMMTLSQFHLAWSRYAVGAHATGQLSYAAAAAHRDVCMTVGLGAARNKRRVQLAVYYDEQARKDWAERSRSGDPTFVARTRLLANPFPRRVGPVGCAQADRVAKRVDIAILNRAEEAYDADEAAAKAAPAESSAKGGNKGAQAPASRRLTRGNSILSRSAIAGGGAPRQRKGAHQGSGQQLRPRLQRLGLGQRQRRLGQSLEQCPPRADEAPLAAAGGPS